MASAERKQELDISLSDFFAVVTDYESYPLFVTGMKSAKVLGPVPGSTHEKRVSFELELIKRVGYVVRVKENFEADKGRATVEWNLESSDTLKVSHGLWILNSIGPQKLNVTYSLDVEFQFSVPGFILKGLVANSLPQAIAEFAQRARSLRASGKLS